MRPPWKEGEIRLGVNKTIFVYIFDVYIWGFQKCFDVGLLVTLCSNFLVTLL